MSRGIRNNNPGNIRVSGTRYKGEKKSSSDPAFKQFESMAWGYRAMFVLMCTYSRKYGLSTIRQIIARYAPPSENHTDKYIEYVARHAGISPDEQINTMDMAVMTAVAAAMSRVENGLDAKPEEVIEGWKLFIRYKP